ncbi:MAG: glycosyltransferase family 39 protein [Terriglobales bacterium]
MASAKTTQVLSDSASLLLPEPSTSQFIFVIALGIGVVHLLTNSRYGFHRDELQFLSDARHLDWGFVSYPPFTPFIERISLGLFGPSLLGLRLFSVIAQCASIVITGLMARELGAGLWAQAVAALGVAVSPLPMFEGTEFQYTTFDYLWWVLIAYLVVRLLKTENPRWCLPIGAVIGVGLMTKYSIIFYVAGIVVGLLLTPARRFIATRWFWLGAGLALLVCLPNLVWQIRHDFVSLHFLRYIHARDVGEGRAEGFWRAQFTLCANRYAAPLWIAGLFGFVFSRRYRAIACMYVLPLIIFWASKGRGYYTAAAYPMLMAMGAVVISRALTALPPFWRAGAQAAYTLALLAWGVYVATIMLPLASNGPLRARALDNNGDLREEIGWNELVKTVAQIRDSLPPQEQPRVGIVVGNYGEQGAIEILGPAYHLPPPISGTNSAWYRRYPTSPPSTLIVVGHSREYVDKTFTSCRLVANNTNSDGIHNEENDDHPDIFLCGAPRVPWPEFWKNYQSFG